MDFAHSLGHIWRIWDAATGEELRSGQPDPDRLFPGDPEGFSCYILDTSWSPNARVVATAHFAGWGETKHGVVVLWDARTGAELRTLTTVEVPSERPMKLLAWSPDSETLLVAGRELTIFYVSDRSQPSLFQACLGGSSGARRLPSGEEKDDESEDEPSGTKESEHEEDKEDEDHEEDEEDEDGEDDEDENDWEDEPSGTRESERA
jgi:hypothetical protein